MNKKKIFLILFWVLLVISFECIYRMTIFKNIIDSDFIQMLFFCLPVAVLLYMITTLFSAKVNKVISTITILFLYFIFFAQMVYFQVYNSVFSVYSMTNGGQVFEFWRTILATINSSLYNYFCLTIPVVLYFLLKNKLFDFSRNDKKIYGLIAAVFVFLTGINFSYIGTNRDSIYSSYNLFFNTHAPILSAKKFGLVTTMSLDLNRTLFGMEEKKVELIINNNEISAPEIRVEYNTLDIDFEKLKENEDDESIVMLHDYFSKLTGTNKNSYTGMFKDKNVVFILAESLDPIAISEELTPTLHKMVNNGFVFNNYYSPVYPASTADGEFRTEWSLISSRGDTLTLYAHRNVYSPFIFANSFNDYNINIYHNYNGDYYKRREYFKALGYKNFKSCYYGLNVTCGTFHESDLEMVKASYKDYIDSEKPFFAYYISISGHLIYNKSGNKMAQKNWKYVKDLDYSEKTKSFIAANMELDKALEFLVDELEKANKLDDTVFVITPDHYPYGLNASNIHEVMETGREEPFDLYRSNLIIWNNNMQPIKVDKVGSQPDVLPTMLNLFGKEYDSRLLIGQDLLSDNEGLVVFANRSFITDKIKYNSLTEEVVSKNDEEVPEPYLKQYNTLVDNQFKISNLVLQSNYYKKVFKNDTKEAA